jgi:arylsulfatase A-like enzyme
LNTRTSANTHEGETAAPATRDTGGAGSEAGRADWRTALLPSLVLLGLVLPLYFLTSIDESLLSLTPPQLLPTYGTAWLLAAVIAVPLALACTVLLRVAGATPVLGAAHSALTLAISGAALAAASAAILYAVLVWLRSFGLLNATPMIWPLSAVALLLAATVMLSAGRGALLRRLGRLARLGTWVGGLTVLSIPFFQWLPDPGPRPAATAGAGKPNIVLLTIDALSAQHMSLYGATRETTPRLTAFAAGATTFEHAYADANFTTSGVASVLTGTRPWQHRSLQLPLWPRYEVRIDSLPAVLWRGGYLTGYAVSNPHAGATKNGLDSYFDFASSDDLGGLQICSDRLSRYFRYICAASQVHLFADLTVIASVLFPARGNWEFDPRLATRPALAWLRRTSRARPVFLWVHVLPPHSPYAAPEPWLGMYDASQLARKSSNSEAGWLYLLRRMSPARQHALEARYDESVRYVDYYAGQFLDSALDILGSNTVVVVTADHGESFGHGYGAHAGPELYDELIHIPLIIKLPGEVHGERRTDLAEQADIAPTLTALAGLPIPPSWEGRPLFSAASLSADAAGALGPIFSMNFEQNGRCAPLTTGSVAVIEGRWKLVEFMGRMRYPLMPQERRRLYDLQTDPGELVDRAATEPMETARLEGLIDQKLARYGGALPTTWRRGCEGPGG